MPTAVAVTPFAEWLEAEIVRRRTSRSKLAAQLKTQPSTIGGWLNDGRLPSTDLCKRIAAVWHLPEDEVLQRAEHLSASNGSPPEPDVPAWLTSLLTELDQAEQEMLGETARSLLRLREQRGPYQGQPRLEDPPPPAGDGPPPAPRRSPRGRQP